MQLVSSGKRVGYDGTMVERKKKPLPKEIEATLFSGRPRKLPDAQGLQESVDFAESNREEDTRIFSDGEEKLEEVSYIDDKKAHKLIAITPGTGPFVD